MPIVRTPAAGTYWIAAYVLSPFGDRIYSLNWASAILTDSVLLKNVIVEWDESGEGFTGMREGGSVQGGVLISNGNPVDDPWATEILNQIGLLSRIHDIFEAPDVFGEEDILPRDSIHRVFVYLSPHTTDIKRVASCPISITWDAAGSPIGADFLAIESLFEPPYLDLFGQGASRFVRILPVVRIADVSGGGWKPWKPFSPGAYKARYFQTALVGYSTDPTVNPVCPTFRWLVDVPDRVDHYTNLTVPAAGLAITFRPDGGANAPFNGGPNGSSVPHITRTIINPNLGDEVRITALTATGCTVKVHDSTGASVGGSGVNIKATGY